MIYVVRCASIQVAFYIFDIPACDGVDRADHAMRLVQIVAEFLIARQKTVLALGRLHIFGVECEWFILFSFNSAVQKCACARLPFRSAETVCALPSTTDNSFSLRVVGAS